MSVTFDTTSFSFWIFLELSLLKNHTVVWSVELVLAEHELIGEIVLAYNRVGSQLLWCALKEYATLKEEVSTVGDGESLLHVVVGDENTDVSILQMPHNLLNLFHGNRVNTSEGLVEHDELRFNGKAACNLTTSALSTRESVSKILTNLMERELVNELL